LRSELGGFGVTHSQIVCGLADGTRQIGLVRNLGIVRKNLEKMQNFFCNFTHFSTKVLHNMQYHPAIAIFSNLVVSWATLFDLFVFFCAKCSGGKIRSSWMDKRTWILLYDSEESTDLVLAEKMNKQ
jgi:hypothetical protein